TYNMPHKEYVFQSWMQQNFRLGDLQEHYEIFRTQCMEYKHYLEKDYITKQKELLQEQIKKNEKQYHKLQQQQKKKKQDLSFAKSIHRKDSILHAEGQLISTKEYEQSKRNILQAEQEHIHFEANLIAQQLTILQQEQQIIALNIQQDNEIAEYERLLNQYRQQLQNALTEWKNNYVLESPIEGKVTMTEYWSNQQTVQIDERVVTIVPNDTMQVVGKMYISSANFGKVKEKQIVNIKLNSFPYMEYGMLKGKIKSIAGVPTQEKGYMAEVELPDGLLTTYNKSLPLIQQTDGTGEIIVKDLTLMQRILQPIRALFDE
ncbi:MAG: HlyD family efflux transporter periplasmic adaptor subunit, partial [Paludibacteraceae bacterium]|nr:HlyD family efflux transporter periplasmic adaptor subunit [Paludibacteraceae bacterium]